METHKLSGFCGSSLTIFVASLPKHTAIRCVSIVISFFNFFMGRTQSLTNNPPKINKKSRKKKLGVKHTEYTFWCMEYSELCYTLH